VKRLALVVLLACGVEDKIGVDEPLAVRDAQFVAGALPASVVEATPRPTAVTPQRTTVRPGLRNVAFDGFVSEDAVAVATRFAGLGGGYWVLPAGQVDPAVPGTRTFRFVADFGRKLPPGRHDLLIAATDIAGRTGSAATTSLCVEREIPDNGNVCDPKAEPPDLVVSLAWDSEVDLDLSVVTPSGAVLSARAPRVGLPEGARVNRAQIGAVPDGVGFLDFDSNRGCVVDGRHVENAVFARRPAPGLYLVYVNLHDACGHAPVRFTVSRVLKTTGEGGTFTVTEVEKRDGSLLRVQANGSKTIGTFVTEFVLP